ncbi:hypothetical protein ACOSQ3_001021 [Xanthoceras sorbifolium]
MENQVGDKIHNCVIKTVHVGCGAGFGGDRVQQFNYLILECLVERTLADRFQVMLSGGNGFYSRMERGTCIITNMGAMDPLGAQEKVLEIATGLGLSVSVAVVHEVSVRELGSGSSFEKSYAVEGGISTYLGAAPIVKSQGSLAGHLLECGCQLKGGILHASKQKVLNFSTCTNIYEVGDPGAYVTPDVVIYNILSQIIDLRDVSFNSLSTHKVLCVGAKPSSILVPDILLWFPKGGGWSWVIFFSFPFMEEVSPGVTQRILSSIIVLDSLKATSTDNNPSSWRQKEHAVHFTKEFTALYTNGPAGGMGIIGLVYLRTILNCFFGFRVGRERIFWRTALKCSKVTVLDTQQIFLDENLLKNHTSYSSDEIDPSPATSGQKVPLYTVCHSRAGDNGNNLNFSIIPHFPQDFERLKMIITPSDKGRNLWSYGNQLLNVIVRNILGGGVICSRRIDRHGKTISNVILCQQVVLP